MRVKSSGQNNAFKAEKPVPLRAWATAAAITTSATLVLLLLMFLTLHVSCSHGVAMSVPISVVASRRANAAGAKKRITASGRSTGLFVAAEAADTASKGIERNSKGKSKGDRKGMLMRSKVANNNYNNKEGLKAMQGKIDRASVTSSISYAISSGLRENVYVSRILDFGSKTIRPVVGAFLLRLRQHLSQQGRGFGLICVGMQQVASMSRLKHIDTALRLKQVEKEAQDNKYSVPHADMDEALRQGLLYQHGKNEEVLKKEGWKNVHSGSHFSLFKRRTSGTKKGPVTYLMMGQIDDVTPRSFLKAQIIKAHRDKWDKTMAAMETIKPSTTPIETGAENSQDILYYSTRWPLPLKDRDYTLARRCKLVPDKRAIVFVSKSVNHPRALVDGALRVDKYWCHSTFFSSCNDGREGKIGGARMFDSPGLSYVTSFVMTPMLHCLLQ